MTSPYGTPVFRFERLCQPEPNTGCWLWWGATDDRMGYGYFHIAREDGDNSKSHMIRAHIASYRMFKGATNGLHVCHTCDTPACVNPDHLFLGTRQDNIDDRERKGRGARFYGEAHPRSTLTEEIVREIRTDGRPTRFIAADYGINPATVRKVKRRKLWGHVP